MNSFRPFLCVPAQIRKGMYYFLFPLISNEMLLARKACVSGDIGTKHVISPSITLTDAWLIQSVCSNPLHSSHAYWYPQTYTLWTTKYFKKLKSCSLLFQLMWWSGQKDFLTKVRWWGFSFFFSPMEKWEYRMMFLILIFMSSPQFGAL